MQPLEFPGWYADARGREAITWQRGPSERHGYRHRTVIRGVECDGVDPDGLEPADAAAARAAGLTLNSFGELVGCELGGDLPCTLRRGDSPTPHTLTFRLELPERGELSLGLTVSVAGQRFAAGGDCFEAALTGLRSSLPEHVGLVCCFTCLFSDYSPAGNGLLGMSCHRSARERYLAVRSKHDYWSVPVTEVVVEAHLCPEYRVRVPGTGYRG